MGLPVWREVPLADLRADPGWRYDDPAIREKLATSLRRHGQLRAVAVRHGPDGGLDVVDGRQLLLAMRALGWERAMVVDVGTLDVGAAQRLALALETRARTDYAALAMAVALMLEDGAAAEALAAASPFTAERIAYFGKLAVFDWSQFASGPEGQAALAWEDDEAPPAALPEPEPAVEPEPAQLMAPLVPDAAVPPQPAPEIVPLPPPATVTATGQMSLF